MYQNYDSCCFSRHDPRKNQEIFQSENSAMIYYLLEKVKVIFSE